MTNRFRGTQFTAVRVPSRKYGAGGANDTKGAKGANNTEGASNTASANGAGDVHGAEDKKWTEGARLISRAPDAKADFEKSSAAKKCAPPGWVRNRYAARKTRPDGQKQQIRQGMTTPHTCNRFSTGGGQPRREQGIALPVVLLLASMMLVLATAWFESSLMATRSANGIVEHLRAFHAADGALALCSRALATGALPMPPDAVEPGEPVAWRRASQFDVQAVAPASAWPGSARAPQCLIEAWRIAARPEVRAFLLTARGFGATDDAQSWLQLQLVFDGKNVEYHWRRVVARPF